MKIAIFSDSNTSSGGGGFISTRITLNQLKKLGHKISLFTNLKEFSNYLKSKKPDLVLHHNISGIIKIYSLCEKYKIPIIATINGNIACLKGTHIKFENKFGNPCLKCNLYDGFVCSAKDDKYSSEHTFTKNLAGFFAVPCRYYRMKKRLEVLNKLSGIIVIGKTMKKILELNGVKNKNFFVVPQPIDNSYFNQKEKNYSGKKIILVIAGSYIKGLHLTLEAFSKLNRNDTELIIVGKPMQKIIKNFKSLKNLKIIPSLSNEELAKLYDKAYLTLFPSIWFEPYGRIWAESLARKTPVIAFNSRGGASDYLTHNKNAYLIDYDIAQLVEGISKILDDKKLHSKLSNQGYNFAKKNLSVSAVTKKLIKIYKKVTNL